MRRSISLILTSWQEIPHEGSKTAMNSDGLYITHGIEGHALTIIRENNGATLWVRDFASIESALDILDEDILVMHERSEIESVLSRRQGFYTAEFTEPEEGFNGYAFMQYILASP